MNFIRIALLSVTVASVTCARADLISSFAAVPAVVTRPLLASDAFDGFSFEQRLGAALEMKLGRTGEANTRTETPRLAATDWTSLFGPKELSYGHFMVKGLSFSSKRLGRPGFELQKAGPASVLGSPATLGFLLSLSAPSSSASSTSFRLALQGLDRPVAMALAATTTGNSPVLLASLTTDYSQIPEPSLYAVVFGTIALAVAVVRRRRAAA